MTRYIAPGQKILLHLDRLQEIAGGRQTIAPVNVEIDLSNRCSLGCEWCHFAYTHTRGPLAGTEKPAGATSGGDTFDTDLLFDIGDQLHAAGVRSVTWTGGGEPTLHPEFDRIIDRWPLPQGIYTHGGHIGQERAELMRRRMSWVYVSLDECTAAAYRDSKGVDRFAAACDGVRHLVRAAGGATIGVGFMLHARNYTRVYDMVSLAIQGLGADYVQFRPAVRYLTSSPGVPDDDRAWVYDAVHYLDRVAAPNVYADRERFEVYRDWAGHEYHTCYWVQLQTVITPDGRLWKCVNRREYAGSEIGDLRKESFAQIWARSYSHAVDRDCRVLCRGHLANQSLTQILHGLGHREFI